MKKQLICILMLMPLMATAFTGNAEIGDLKYNIVTKGKTAEVIGLAYGKKPTEIVIPETIEYEGVICNVISICDYAFDEKDWISSVTIPKSVKEIGYRAFHNCYELSNIIFSNGLISIGDNCFSGCKNLKMLIIPSGVTEIGEQAFISCSGLTSVFIPSSVNVIGQAAFVSCSGLNSVHIEDLASWCQISFKDVYANPLSYAQHLYINQKEITDLIIPQGVTTISYGSFYSCKGLKSITLPNSVISIGGSAFMNCSGIKIINLGSSITNLYASAFANCSEITDVYCYSEKIPGYYNELFKDSYINYATLHVLDNLVGDYKTASGWKGFGTIIGIDSESLPQCAKPEIAFNEGSISFSCVTEGVGFVPEVVYADKSINNIDNINLASKYTIRVYATKNGYRNSDVTTAEIIIGYGQAVMLGDVDGNGKVNVADHVELSKIILNQ